MKAQLVSLCYGKTPASNPGGGVKSSNTALLRDEGSAIATAIGDESTAQSTTTSQTKVTDEESISNVWLLQFDGDAAT